MQRIGRDGLGIEAAAVVLHLEAPAGVALHPQLDMARWWRHTASLKLLMAEYVKYTLARARLAVESPWGTTPAATPVRSAAAKAEADAR